MSLSIQTGHRRKGRSAEGAERNSASIGTAAVFLHERRACRSLLRRHEHGYEQWTEGQRGELTYAGRCCKRLLRRPCTGWHDRVLRGRCGGQVDGRNGLWLRVGASTRRADEGGVLHLVGQRRSYPQES